MAEAFCITSIYTRDGGDPAPNLRFIAEAGFSHVHWSHHWNDDFLYATCEIDRIEEWFAEFGLKMPDLHGSAGREKNWAAPEEYRRRAGVELVRNRLEMTARLGGGAVVMHDGFSGKPDEAVAGWDSLRRSLDELQPCAEKLGVRIAMENSPGNWQVILKTLESYGPSYLGLCYDSGHGNVGGDGLDKLDSVKDRLIAVHLHDNDGSADQHRLPFNGTIDWTRLSWILHSSSYKECISLESAVRNESFADEKEFLQKAFETAGRLTAMTRGENIIA